MRKSADAVILMQQNFDISDIKVLYPQQIDWDKWCAYRPDVPFSDSVIESLGALSASLLRDPESRLYPDVTTFAFFCRKANLLKLKRQYADEAIRLGRGIVFHIAPSNVPVNFAYSLVAGLLAGNNNVVRVSSKEFPQVDIIIRHLYELQQENNENYHAVLNRIALVRYGHESKANDYFSSICEVRVIWGGDRTISQVRKSELPSRSFDITFADRYSFAVINADELVKETDMGRIAEGFYNDTYLFDQNACSTPHLIVWLGSAENKKRAKDAFWSAVSEEVKKKRYPFQPVTAVDKLTAFYRQSQAMEIKKVVGEDNLLVRVQLDRLCTSIDVYRCSCGYFSEYDASDLSGVVPIIKYKYQTMAVYGVDKSTLSDFVLNNHLIGIDRIVPIGKTTSFSLTWDGYDLISSMSRRISYR
jgi:hypothetical protein